MVNITPYEAMEIVDNGYNQLELIIRKPTQLFKTMYYYYLNLDLLMVKGSTAKRLSFLSTRL